MHLRAAAGTLTICFLTETLRLGCTRWGFSGLSGGVDCPCAQATVSGDPAHCVRACGTALYLARSSSDSVSRQEVQAHRSTCSPVMPTAACCRGSCRKLEARSRLSCKRLGQPFQARQASAAWAESSELCEPLHEACHQWQPRHACRAPHGQEPQTQVGRAGTASPEPSSVAECCLGLLEAQGVCCAQAARVSEDQLCREVKRLHTYTPSPAVSTALVLHCLSGSTASSRPETVADEPDSVPG